MNGKKVGILTFFNRLNYGAELQAYALHKKVKDLGYDCEILDLLSPNHISAKMPELYKPLSVSKKIRTKKSRVNKKLFEALDFIGAVLNSNNVRIRKEQFGKFKQTYMTVSEQKYCSVDDLYHHKTPYDIFITGSDQVWNPQTLISSPEPYFLTFASKDKKKISYAPSFGVSSIPDEVKDKYAKWLANIDCLSVREKQGADIISEITGRTAEVVLDPTLLLNSEDWNEVAVDPEFNKPYILLYVMMYSPYVTKLAHYLSQKTGYSIIRIARGNTREGLDYKIINLYNAGPSEFLGLFKNASFVLTSSFHGTVFSINYNKPFYSIARKGGAANSRLTSILDNLNLRSRLLFVGDTFPEEKNISIDFSEADDIFVDFSKANLALQKEREKSLAFLNKAMKD